MVGSDDLADLRRLLSALQPYLDRLLIIGGWAHRLYRLSDDVTVPAYEPIFTTDTDIAIPNIADVPPDAILGRLRSHGFVEEFLGQDKPPVTHYHLATEQSDFYAEFLTPLVRRRREKMRDTTIVGGVVAQTLRNLDILLIEPWSVRVIDDAGLVEFNVRLPNPVTYIAQKLIVLEDRRAEDKPKDILYVHDTLELFGARFDGLRRTWQQAVRPALGKTSEDVVALAHKYFGNVTDDIRRAVLVAGTRRLDPETLRMRCKVGLETILAGD